MPEVILKDHSIHEPNTLHQHPLETIPQGSQSDGVINGHDHRDVDAGLLAKCVIGLFALILFSIVSMMLFTQGLLNTLSKRDTVPSATFSQREDLKRSWPAERMVDGLQAPDAVPALLQDPEKPMVVLREQDEAILGGYDWIEGESGRREGVTIPVDRAIDLTLERGLPTEQRTQPKIEKPTGEVVALGSIPAGETQLKQEKLKIEQAGGKPGEGAAPH